VNLLLLQALLLAGLTQIPAAPPPGACVVASEERGDARAAAAAALSVLEGATRLTATQAQGTDLSARCSGVVALGAPAWNAVRTGNVPVVVALVPGVQALEGGPVAAVVPDPDPDLILGTLAAMAPRARRIGVVYDPDVTGALVSRARDVAEAREIEIVARIARDQAAAIRAFHSLEREVEIDALWILPDRTTTTYETAHQALKLAHWKRIPVVGPSRWYVANGALFALEPNHEDHGRLAAERLRAILAGQEVPRTSHAESGRLLVNRRTLDRLGLRLSPRLQSQVSELIQ
jgi:putative tryptophan/tyrosine transport system substrate-binding protein